MQAADDIPAPSQPEGSGTFWMVTWNIVDGRGRRLTQAAAGLAQMRVGLVVEEKDCLEVGLFAVAEDLPMVVG